MAATMGASNPTGENESSHNDGQSSGKDADDEWMERRAYADLKNLFNRELKYISQQVSEVGLATVHDEACNALKFLRAKLEIHRLQQHPTATPRKEQAPQTIRNPAFSSNKYMGKKKRRKSKGSRNDAGFAIGSELNIDELKTVGGMPPVKQMEVRQPFTHDL